MTPQEFHAARRQVETPFGQIAYIEAGAGPVALFLHGLPLCSYEWRHVIACVASRRRCVAPDLMGLGYSDVPASQDISFAAQAAMLVAFLDALGIEAVDVVGNDTGGGIAQIFVATHPSRVKSLTLTNCEVHDLWPNALLAGFYQSVVAGDITAAMKVMVGNAEFGQQQLGILVYEDAKTFSAESIAVYLEPLLASEKRIDQFKRLADWATHRSQLMDIAPRLAVSIIPAQVVWGDGDVVFDTAPSLDWLRRNLGGLRRSTIVSGAKLFFPEEHAGKLATRLLDFWT